MCKHRTYERECSCKEANGGHYFACPFHTTEAAERVCKFFNPINEVIYKIVTVTDGTCVAAFLSSETSIPQMDAGELMKELSNVKIIEIVEPYDRSYQ